MSTKKLQVIGIKKGEDGKSAYQHAQAGGYTGSEEEFNRKLAAQPDWNQNDEDSFDYIKNRPFRRYGLIPETTNTAIPSLDTMIPLNTWTDDDYNAIAYNSFIKIEYIGCGPYNVNVYREYEFIFEITSGNGYKSYSTIFGKTIAKYAEMIDEVNYRSPILTDNSVKLYFILDRSTLTEEYASLFISNGIYLWCNNEAFQARVTNMDSQVYNYVYMDSRYIGSDIQRVNDENLQTESKEIVGAINEINGKTGLFNVSIIGGMGTEDDPFIMDRTFVEILEAHNTGKNVYLNDMVPLSAISSTGVMFHVMEPYDGEMCILTVDINESNKGLVFSNCIPLNTSSPKVYNLWGGVACDSLQWMGDDSSPNAGALITFDEQEEMFTNWLNNGAIIRIITPNGLGSGGSQTFYTVCNMQKVAADSSGSTYYYTYGVLLSSGLKYVQAAE